MALGTVSAASANAALYTSVLPLAVPVAMTRSLAAAQDLQAVGLVLVEAA